MQRQRKLNLKLHCLIHKCAENARWDHIEHTPDYIGCVANHERVKLEMRKRGYVVGESKDAKGRHVVIVYDKMMDIIYTTNKNKDLGVALVQACIEVLSSH